MPVAVQLLFSHTHLIFATKVTSSWGREVVSSGKIGDFLPFHGNPCETESGIFAVAVSIGEHLSGGGGPEDSIVCVYPKRQKRLFCRCLERCGGEESARDRIINVQEIRKFYSHGSARSSTGGLRCTHTPGKEIKKSSSGVFILPVVWYLPFTGSQTNNEGSATTLLLLRCKTIPSSCQQAWFLFLDKNLGNISRLGYQPSSHLPAIINSQERLQLSRTQKNKSGSTFITDGRSIPKQLPASTHPALLFEFKCSSTRTYASSAWTYAWP